MIPDDMDYGDIEEIRTHKVLGGLATHPIVIFRQSISVRTDSQVIILFNDLLERFKRGELINPGIQVEVYSDTGKIKRVVKSWTEVR
jgi:hypothetical protein